MALVALVGCGEDIAITASAVGGPQGRVPQFVVDCGFSHLAADDPIVSPNDPGSSHMHTFFGAHGVDAYTTYEEFETAETTCDQTLDRASYWAPALYANDDLVEPIRARAYYRPGPGVDPANIEPYPAGLKLIAGDASSRGPQSADLVGFSCGTGGVRRALPETCDTGSPLVLTIVFPDCWDGERIDSADHESHSAYSGSSGCPDSHPTPLPQLLLAIEYPYEGTPDALALSSGSLFTAHADFWNGWDQDKLETEVRSCLHRELVCGLVG